MTSLSLKTNNFATYALVALRIVIGWHLLYEGISKALTPGWTAAEFLSVSAWIFSPFFNWLADSAALLAVVDIMNTWLLIVVGIALFLGIFDRIAAIAGMALLALYWLANPPLAGVGLGIVTEGNYMLVDKNMVEFFALLLLALLPTGRYIGLAHLLKKNRNKKVYPGYIMATDDVKKQDNDPAPVAAKGTIDRRTLLRGLATCHSWVYSDFHS
jgi:thiosulfate dehydrogenase (quinone) large subunit